MLRARVGNMSSDSKDEWRKYAIGVMSIGGSGLEVYIAISASISSGVGDGSGIAAGGRVALGEGDMDEGGRRSPATPFSYRVKGLRVCTRETGDPKRS